MTTKGMQSDERASYGAPKTHSKLYKVKGNLPISPSAQETIFKTKQLARKDQYCLATSAIQSIPMAVPNLPYSVEYHNSLPDIADAKIQFDSLDADKILFTDIGRAFVKHHVEIMLGVVLLHNHFLLAQDEILVNVGPVAVPWKTDSGAKELKDVYPSSWGFTKDGIAAYEFGHAAPRVALDSQLQLFLSELGAILTKRNMTGLFGICALDDGSIDRPTSFEFNEGRANITFPFDFCPHKGSNVDAMWQLSSGKDGATSTNDKGEVQPRVSNACGKKYKLQQDTHMQSHRTRDEVQSSQIGSSHISETLQSGVTSSDLGDSAQSIVSAQCKVRCNSFQRLEDDGRSGSNCDP